MFINNIHEEKHANNKWESTVSQEMWACIQRNFHLCTCDKKYWRKNGWILADSYANSDSYIPDECEKTSAVI